MATHRLQNFVGSRPKAREDRCEGLADLLPESLPLDVGGIQHSEPQFVSLADDVDYAYAQCRSVELNRYRGHLDFQLMARRGPVGRRCDVIRMLPGRYRIVSGRIAANP